jgi:rhodanese-related sulfurtransferase
MFSKRKSTIKINIEPKVAFELIQSHKNDHNFVILDVRNPDEFAEYHLAQAKNLDFYSPFFKEELEKLDKNKIYLIYCKSGRRGSKSVKTMKQIGFQNIYNIAGGIERWSGHGLPLN